MSAADNPGFRRGELTVHRDPAELARVTRALRATGRTVHLVPTMGALHRGHLELIRRARDVNAVVVVSIFVNPLQFGPNEDYDRYPSSFSDDVEACREAGVGLVFAPGVDDMYPPGRELSVRAGPLGDELEGAIREGHFDGVLTVVLKLLNIVRPDLAFFGEKDYQQLTLIRKMAREFNLETLVQGIPTIREADGLALSSRNVYLSAEQRASALVLSAALSAGAHAGRRGPRAVLDAAREVLVTEPSIEVDYLELRDPELGPAPQEGEARLLVAAKAGATRLIDNAKVLLGE